jgi:hypothetical protein
MLAVTESTPAAADTPPRVLQLRQALLWPLRLMQASGSGGAEEAAAARAPWQALRDLGERSPWREQSDEYTGDAEGFHERHYNEFVTFLPFVQRFLYGHGRAARGHGDAGAAGSPMRIFRRTDIAAARVVPRPGDPPVTLSVVHIDLYFFYGVEVVLLNVEVASEDLPLPLAQDLMYRFGRAYPPGWDAAGQPLHCLAGFEWLDAQGRVLVTSDAQDRETFLRHVAEHRAPRIARHWEFVLAPLVNHHSMAEGPLRYRQIEYYRMPMTAYLALDDPRRLSRHDFIRLGLVTGGNEALASAAAPGGPLPFSEAHLADFELQFCYDRFWADAGAAPHTRYLCSGLALVVVGTAGSEFYRCKDRGVLAQFRHQHFLLFLIAHLQKATLLMYSDRLAEALTAMDVTSPSSVKRFKRQIRLTYVGFLGFTHRYWFHEVSEQAHVKALFHMCTRHLGIDALYEEVKERVRDMNSYLDADSLRRQANTVVRLTVVTIFGLVGTVTTGFLGMNLLAEADASIARKVALFFAIFVPTIALTMYTMVKSKRLSDFLDVVSDERVRAWPKFKAFFAVWRSPRD